MKRMKNNFTLLLLAILAIMNLATCTKETGFRDIEIPGEQPGGILGNGTDDGNVPDFDSTISTYAGEMADDASKDIVGTNEDIYWEANSFTETVLVTYNGTRAAVTTANNLVLYQIDGAYVTIDMQTHAVKNVEIILSGQSDDGQLKIYGEKKFKLTLADVELTCTRGPAINNQCKKRTFIHLAEGTTNRLTDSATYSDEPYYLNGADPDDEDRKGCLFSEGNLIFSGTGLLIVEGKQKHGIATDGYFYMRPGTTLVVTDAAKNAIHVKGDTDDNIGIYIAGGLIYAHTSATAGKGLKTDLHVEVAGGQLRLNTSGNSEYDSEEQDTSSPACIKTDGDVIISGGTHLLKSTGTGGKGINADGSLLFSGSTTTVTTTGGKYIYDEARDLTSSPKGVKADGDITISGGNLNISVTGVSDGSEGLESKATLTISGGEIYSYAYDDAINASTAINISGGKVYAYASNNDGIDSNGTLTITGGLVIGVGTSSPEGGIDVDNSNDFKIDGGTVIAVGGTLQSNPSSSSQQRSVVYNGISASKGTQLCLLDSDGNPELTFELPRTLNNGCFFFSTPSITSGASYTISSGGSITAYTDSWNGWYEGGSWSEGTSLETFTSSSTVTTLGNNMGGFGGGGMGGDMKGRP